MEKGRLSSYCLMIASMHFNSVDDFKHLEMATKKAQGNTEKFKYNPISLDQNTRHIFPNVETLHVYEEDNEEFRDEHFYKRIHHYGIKYSDWLERDKSEEDVFLKVILCQADSKERGAAC